VIIGAFDMRTDRESEGSFSGIQLVGGILPEEPVMEIIYWSGDTPYVIADERSIEQIMQSLREVQCEEYVPEEMRAGYVKIELKYEMQTIALTMQTDNISTGGKHYLVNTSLSEVLDLCREIVNDMEK
ncbi:MAG: hypothetical protein IJZ82_04065, partial [Lachnospiraceae bacterium]|nr:hypothetical protein [Lachnospiraceae bacterium]